jgi:hypothetical protein
MYFHVNQIKRFTGNLFLLRSNYHLLELEIINILSEPKTPEIIEAFFIFPYTASIKILFKIFIDIEQNLFIHETSHPHHTKPLHIVLSFMITRQIDISD